MEQPEVIVDEASSPEEKAFPCEGDPLEGRDVDNKAKILWIACKRPELSSILDDLEKETLEKIVDVLDRNGMNIFHALLFNPNSHRWFAKKLETEARTNVVKFIEAISQNFPNKIKSMLIHQDNYERTPLHYAGIIDVENEMDESNITLALLKCGADEVLFVKDKRQETPVSFIGTSNLKAHLDTKQEIEGPVGHEDQMFHCDLSILQPKVEDEANSKNKNPVNFEFLEILAEKHRDLFDHSVISAMIW